MVGLFRCFSRRHKRNKALEIGEKEERSSRTRSSSPQQPNHHPEHNNDDYDDEEEEDVILDPAMRFSPRSNGSIENRRSRSGSHRRRFSPRSRQPPGSPLYLENDLSRITEEPTDLSTTTTGQRQRITPNQVAPPPARVAAFHGPPRFDWMDIETHAAIKLQSLYRRNKVMNALEAQGVSTSAIRNRKRRRKANKKAKKTTQSEDTPTIFSCCAVGLAFGDATEEDEQAYREFQKKQYEQRVVQQQMHETALRKQYLRSHGAEVGNVVEQIEVVE